MNFFSIIINWWFIFWRGLAAAWRLAVSWFFVRTYLIIALSFNILSWVAMILIYRNLAQDLAVLHYNIDFGIDLIGSRAQLFLNPTLGLILIICDWAVVLFLTKSRDFKFFAHLVLAAAALVNFVLALSVIAVYLINFR